ncbi:hypothetical protein WBP07_10710 [Novosphingobium sp. BL-8A]|uniref:hypothetical protein n=1 Tax=Novosphingobium sp. BL-8A TaxID=3127639 RepID=UPI0037564675
MGFQRIFWKYAHRRYQARTLSILPELAVGSWGLFFVFVYAGAFVAGWYPTLVEAAVALFLTGFPVGYCILHWRIRKEKAKGADALYRKLVSVSSFRRT